MPTQFEVAIGIVGTVGGILLTTGGVVIGHWINRRNVLDTSKVDDRGKFTQDVMAQWAAEVKARQELQEDYDKYKEATEAKMDRLEALLDQTREESRRRENRILRAFASMGQELGIMNLHLETVEERLAEDEDCRSGAVVKQHVKRIAESIERIRASPTYAEMTEMLREKERKDDR